MRHSKSSLAQPSHLAVLLICFLDARCLAFVVRRDFAAASVHKTSRPSRRRGKSLAGIITMDTEGIDSFAASSRLHLQVASRRPVQLPRHKLMPIVSPRAALGSSELALSHGMPWTKSIDPLYSFTYNDVSFRHPFYMPFWEQQLTFMQTQLKDLRPVPVTSSEATDMSYIATDKVRLHTCAFESKEYSRIRMTVMDAGHNTQVFTALFYPRANLPVFGIDLLQFRAKHLCVMDFQPIHADEQVHACDYEDVLGAIRDRYPQLQGKMTKRFYDESRHFSRNTMLGRHEGKEGHAMVWEQVFPAFQESLQAHLALARRVAATHCESDTELVRQGQAAYDTYSAARDPAHALLARTFGQKWADDYVYDILFPNAARPNGINE